jgi:glycosyltransferase involved in cell wall biosynthesis
MKIIHIIPNLKKGGAERLAINIVQAMSERPDLEVVLVTFTAANDYSFLTENIHWKVIPSKVVPSLSRKSLVEVDQLQKFIDDFQPNFIHSHLFESEMVLSKIKTSSKTKRVIHFHSNMKQLRLFSWKTLFNKQYLTDFYERNMVLKSYSNQDEFICISEDTRKFATDVLPFKRGINLLFNAIDLRRFKQKSTNIDSNEITIIGSLVDKKGQELAIKTISELKDRGLKVQLNILGSGPNLDKLRNLVDQLKIQQNVLFHGNQDFPELYLQNSKLYLHTAIYEPFGLVLVEAMSCGLPVVTTDGFGNRDLILEGENGFMIWERDPKQIADKIELLFKDNGLREKMSNNAIKFAQQFDINQYVDSLLEIYLKSI